MKCPVCDVELKIAERQGIEIDYCPTCRGVWLDRGELDKIIERTASLSAEPTPARPDASRRGEAFDDDWDDGDDRERRRFRDKDQRRRSFLGDLFDVFD